MTGIMELLEADGIHPKKVSIKEYHSPCPVCGGKDRFVTWPSDGKTGRAWCRQCDLKVDGIGYLMEVHHMTFPEAVKQIGKPLRAFPARGNRANTHRRGESPVYFEPEPEKAEPEETGEPSPAWSETAEKFITWTAGNLRRNPEQLKRLHRERGISPATAERWRLGWNPEPLKRPGKPWGERDELSFPVGLVIPNIRGEKPVSLNIRRVNGETKYHRVKGSRMFPYLLPGEIFDGDKMIPVNGTIAIVEGEFDALLLWETARDVVFTVAMGGCSQKPDMKTMELIARAPVLLDCMDNDSAGDGAGAWWKEWFPDCSRWKPIWKDPGEMHTAGENVRRWILDGILSVRRERGIPTEMIDFFTALDTLGEPFPPDFIRGLSEDQIERAAIMAESGVPLDQVERYVRREMIRE